MKCLYNCLCMACTALHFKKAQQNLSKHIISKAPTEMSCNQWSVCVEGVTRDYLWDGCGKKKCYTCFFLVWFQEKNRIGS